MLMVDIASASCRVGDPTDPQSLALARESPRFFRDGEYVSFESERRRQRMPYMDKERAESATRHKEYLAWLKGAQAESRTRRKAFVASTRKYSATIGKEKE